MDHSEQIGDIVQDAARDIFVDCGASNDYCIQSVSMASVVFGGTNRIIWTPTKGFRADRSYCTKRFLESFDKMVQES